MLEKAFATAPAATWIDRLATPVCWSSPSRPMDRDTFRRGILDDPVNRELGRVIAYETADWGHFEQIGPLLRRGPVPDGAPQAMLPGIGEHTVEVLGELGFGRDVIDELLGSGSLASSGPRPDLAAGAACQACVRSVGRSAAWRTARMIPWYPVQRQRLPVRASRISSSVGFRVVAEERRHRHDEARCAEAALQSVTVAERLLHRGQTVVIGSRDPRSW